MQLCVIMELPFRAALRKLVLYKADPLFPFNGGRKHLFEHPSCTFKQRSNCSLHQLLHLCAAPLSEGAAVCTKQLLPLFVLAGILTQVIKALTGVSNSSRARVPRVPPESPPNVGNPKRADVLWTQELMRPPKNPNAQSF